MVNKTIALILAVLWLAGCTRPVPPAQSVDNTDAAPPSVPALSAAAATPADTPQPTAPPLGTPAAPEQTPLDPSLLLYGVTRLSVQYSYFGEFDDDYAPFVTEDAQLLRSFVCLMSDAQEVGEEHFNETARVPKAPAELVADIDGQSVPITFAIDTLYERCVFRFGDAYYMPHYDAGRYVMALESYRPANGDVPADAAALLGAHGWQPVFRHARIAVTLPDTLLMKPGEFPEKMYWHYYLVMSRHVGYDYSAYLGQAVTAEMYRVVEPIMLGPNHARDVDAVLLRSGDDIVGAFLSLGRHYAFTSALDRSSFEDITGQAFGAWFGDNGYDTADPVYIRLKGMTPEQVITGYVDALGGRGGPWMAYLSAECASQLLFSNMADSMLYNAPYVPGHMESTAYIGAERVDDPDGRVVYGVKYDFVASGDYDGNATEGTEYVFFTMEEEGASGWRILSIGH